MTKEKTRILSYDVIRITAILLVVLVHSAAKFVDWYLPPSAEFAWGNALDSLARVGVPLFIMVSGALTLDESKNITFGTMMKRIKGIAVLLFCWSAIYAVHYYICLPDFKQEEIVWKDFWMALVYGNYHLWFLYMMIGLYLITPVLRLFVKKENSRYVLYFLGLSALLHFLTPVLNFAVNRYTSQENYVELFVEKFEVGFLHTYLTYYLLGWYLAHNPISGKQRAGIYILGAVGFLVTLLGSYFYTTASVSAYDVFYGNDSINILCYGGAVFTFLFYAFRDREIKTKWGSYLLLKMSTLSFGVYAIHSDIIYLLKEYVFNENPAGYTALLIWLIAVLISYGLAGILSKIPVLRKLVRA